MPDALPYFLFFCLLIFSLKTTVTAQNKTETNRYIAAIIDADTRIGKEQKTAIKIAIEDFNNNSAASKLSVTILHSSSDPFRAALIAQELISDGQQIKAIIGPSTSQETALVADIGNRAKVVVLSFATATVNPPLTSLRWPYLVRMASNDSVQMRCIAAIVKSYKWRKVIAIYEDNGYADSNSGTVTLLADALRSVGSDIETRYAFPQLSSLFDSKTVIRDELQKLKREQCKVFVVGEMSLPLAVVIFAEAKQLGMMEKGYVWITTDSLTSLLDSVNSSVISSMEGVLGIKTYFHESNPSNRQFRNRFRQNFRLDYPEEENHEPSIFALRAYDAVSVVYRNLATDPIQGQTLVSAVLASRFKGLSGEISFKDGGLSNVAVFRIINVVGKSYREVGFWTPKLGFSEKFNGPSKALGLIYWPGGPNSAPQGWAPKPLKIAVPKDATVQFVSATKDPKSNVTVVSGFSFEVFEEVVKVLWYDLPHEFEIFDGTYTEMVENVSLKNFDGAIGDITILANRSRHVDFSQPYAESGLTMLVTTESKDSEKAWMFMKPFTKTMWLLTGAIFVYTGFVVWVLEHRQNPDFRGPWPSQIGTLLWFTFSTLFFAHRERVQSNFTRIVIVVWLIVVFILTSSYTASLTSMLTVRRLEPKVTDIEWLKQSNAMVGCRLHSFVCKYIEDVLHFNPKYIKKLHNIDDYPTELSSHNVSAIFLEIPYARLVVAKYCKGYTTTGLGYKFGGFGFVFPQGSPLANDVSKAILELSENGKLKYLEDKVFSSSSKCASSSTNIENSGSLGLDNFWGLFAITGGTSTIILIHFVVDLIRKFRKHCGEFEGNASPSDESIWKRTVILARYFDKGQIHPPQKATISSLAYEGDWCSYVSENHTPEHPQSSPMSIEGP